MVGGVDHAIGCFAWAKGTNHKQATGATEAVSTREGQSMNPRILHSPVNKERYTQRFDPAGIEGLFSIPVEVMLFDSERLTLFSIITGLQPDRMLEIGTWKGGSAAVIVKAMDSIQRGYLVSVDPNPMVSSEHLKTIEHRTALVTAPSPDGLDRARQIAGAPFDLVFVDGYHSQENVVADTLGVLAFLSDDAYILFHDANYPEVENGINESLARKQSVLQDCGVINRAMGLVEVDGHEMPMCGMRLVAYSRSGL